MSSSLKTTSPSWAERGDDAGVGHVAAAEEQRGLGALELGEARLEPAVDGHVAADQPRSTGADAPATSGISGCFADPGVVRQTEIVVRTHHQHGLAVEQNARALRSGDQPHAAVEALVFEGVQMLFDDQS